MQAGAHPLCLKAEAVLQRLRIGLSILAAPRQVVHPRAKACRPLLQLAALLIQVELCLRTPATSLLGTACSTDRSGCTRWRSRQRPLWQTRCAASR